MMRDLIDEVGLLTGLGFRWRSPPGRPIRRPVRLRFLILEVHDEGR